MYIEVYIYATCCFDAGTVLYHPLYYHIADTYTTLFENKT